jgi:NADPH:quinone reductase-like Zn-dependent oxidoreductase
MMRGIIQTEAGNPKSLALVDNLSKPNIKDGDILVKVQFAAINRLDLLQAQASNPSLPDGASSILGVEISGIVVDLNDSVSGVNGQLSVGDKVMALVPGGGYAEYCVCDVRTVIKIPEGISLEIAAAIPEAFMTAYKLLFYSAQIKQGETVVIHAAASSIGQAAIQLARLRGAIVIATTRSEEKSLLCSELGANVAITIDEPTFASKVISSNGGKRVDAVLDPVGGAYLKENVEVLGVDGR